MGSWTKTEKTTPQIRILQTHVYMYRGEPLQTIRHQCDFLTFIIIVIGIPPPPREISSLLSYFQFCTPLIWEWQTTYGTPENLIERANTEIWKIYVF